MSEHSGILGGSTAGRVLNCPASVELSKDIPPPPPSEFAIEGTACHTLMEYYLDNDVIFKSKHIGETFNAVELTADRYHDKILPATEATEELFKRTDVKEFIAEARVTYHPVAGSFGTCDILAKGRDDLVVVGDYKFGHNIVSPVSNTQLMFYALAALHDPAYADFWTGDDDQPVLLAIIQPENMRHKSCLWTWELTVRDLVLYDINLRQSMGRVTKGDTPICGSWCQYCPAASVCPTKLNEARSVNKLKQSHLNDLSVAMALVEELEPWIKQVKKLTHEQMERGDKIEGYKLVQKRAMRKWRDGTEEDLMATIVEEGFTPDDMLDSKLKSPAQLEKIFKRAKIDFDDVAEYIVSSSSGTTVVPADDSREEVIVMTSDNIPDHLKMK